MKKIFIGSIFFIIIVAIIVIINSYNGDNYVDINGEKIIVEIAQTDKEQQQGLMFRENLCNDCGMLFVFKEEALHSFWMKNTLIPLDMVFINSDLKVVDIIQAVPCVEDFCRHYSPKENALYVLETNMGKFDKKIIGEKVKITLPHQDL